MSAFTRALLADLDNEDLRELAERAGRAGGAVLFQALGPRRLASAVPRVVRCRTCEYSEPSDSAPRSMKRYGAWRPSRTLPYPA